MRRLRQVAVGQLATTETWRGPATQLSREKERSHRRRGRDSLVGGAEPRPPRPGCEQNLAVTPRTAGMGGPRSCVPGQRTNATPGGTAYRA